MGNLNSEFGHVSVISEGQAVRNSKAITNLGLQVDGPITGARGGGAYQWGGV